MKHIQILGKLGNKYLADFEDKGSLIISMNKHSDENLIPRVDKWFDLHLEPEKEDADFTIDNFPFGQCHELVKGRRFCSTMAYMIAWAILQGAEKISIYGARFSDDGNTRRARELHNVREMLFFCLGRGIEINICEDDVQYLFPEHIPEIGSNFDD